MLPLLRFFTFFYVFFKIQKKRDFLRFFALLHTFSRTVIIIIYLPNVSSNKATVQGDNRAGQ